MCVDGMSVWLDGSHNTIPQICAARNHFFSATSHAYTHRISRNRISRNAERTTRYSGAFRADDSTQSVVALAPPVGFEPTTVGLEDRCSVPLS